MVYFRSFIFIILILNFNIVKSDESIFYVDLEYLLNNSSAGKKLIVNINKIQKVKKDYYQKIGVDLRKEEEKLFAQKNLLKNDEFKIKLDNLKNKVKKLTLERSKDFETVSKERINKTNSLLKEIEPIISNYAKKNAISMIIQKKNIVIAKDELDLTEVLLELIDKNIK